MTAGDFFCAHFNGADLTHKQDFHIEVFVAEFKELSVDLREHIVDLSLLKSGKSLGTISKQLQVQQLLHGTAVLLP